MSKIVLHDKEFSLFIPADRIQAEVQTISDRMNAELKDEEVIFIGILNGAFMFASDLLRKIQFDAQVSFVKVASYQGISSRGNVKRLIGINEVLKDKTVVIIEDIIDTGITIENIVIQIKAYRPRQVYIASLLVKPQFDRNSLTIDYVGFEIPDRFVVGYGLDYMGYGRNLRNLYILEE